VNQHQPIEQLWDAYRDGDISAADKAVFEQFLADHPDQKALFDAESQWLTSLHDQPVIRAMAYPANTKQHDFAAAVLNQWDEQSKPVLARIHWKSAAFSAGWLAAAAMIAIAMWINAPQASVDQTRNTTVATRMPGMDGSWRTPDGRMRDHRHPLTSLVQDMDQTYEEQPTNVFAAFGSMMNLSQVEVTPIQQASYTQEH
jgi:hypothetical protein